VPAHTAVARALGEEALFEDYPEGPDLTDIRAAVERLAPIELAPGDVRSALGLVAEHATINPYAALTSRHPAITRLKLVTRKLTFFVAHSIAVQVTELAHALLVAGAATADRIDLLEMESNQVRRELDELRRRLDRDTG